MNSSLIEAEAEEDTEAVEAVEALVAREVRKADVVHVPLPGDIPLLGMFVALGLRKRLVVRYGGSWVPTSRRIAFESCRVNYEGEKSWARQSISRATW